MDYNGFIKSTYCMYSYKYMYIQYTHIHVHIYSNIWNLYVHVHAQVNDY